MVRLSRIIIGINWLILRRLTAQSGLTPEKDKTLCLQNREAQGGMLGVFCLMGGVPIFIEINLTKLLSNCPGFHQRLDKFKWTILFGLYKSKY
jgi:hypothetical protein